MRDSCPSNPAQIARSQIRSSEHTGITYGLAPDYVQCNLVILKAKHAYEFLVFCQRNQRACPVLEVTETGSYEPKRIAPQADLRTDIPKYNVFRNGKLTECPKDLSALWESDFVSFLIGSGISFDATLSRAGISVDRRHRWVLRSTIPTDAAGPFRGNMVVTMRWMSHQDAIKATQITARFPFNHGAPIHIGSPDQIGADLKNPLHGPEIGPIPTDQIPVFWACGVTPQVAAEAAKLDIMITHAPAHGFITDLKTNDVSLP